jgi:O-antigen ligase
LLLLTFLGSSFGTLFCGLPFSESLLSTLLVCCVLLSVLNPILSTAFILCISVARPWEALPSYPSLLLIPKLAFGAWFASILVNMRGEIPMALRRLRDVRSALCLFGAVVLWFFVSTVASENPEISSLTFSGEFLKSVTFLVVITVTASLFRSHNLFMFSLALAIVGVAAISILSFSLKEQADSFVLYAWLPDGDSIDRLKGIGLLANANDIAAAAVIPIFHFSSRLVELWTNIKESDHSPSLASVAAVTPFYVIAVAIPFYAVAQAQSRGALLAIAAGIVAIFFAYMKSKFWAVLFAGGGVAGFGVLLSRAFFNRSVNDLQGSLSNRMNHILTAIRISIDHPITGVGIGMYPHKYEQYAPSLEGEWGMRTVHSSWFLALSESGFPGLILFALLFAIVVRMAWNLTNKTKSYIGSMIAYGVAMSFLSHTYIFLPYALMAAVIAAHIDSLRESPAADKCRGRSDTCLPSPTGV